MKILALDDEPRALHMLEIMLEQIGFDAEVKAFLHAEEALGHLKNDRQDIIFLDVEMREMSGIEFADLLLELADPPAVVFVTGHNEYACRAWDVEAIDYVLKPYSKEQIWRAIERYLKKYQPLRLGFQAEKKIKIQCFPNFDVYVDGKPIAFRHKKSKELLAFLVHNMGAWVSVDKIAFILFEDYDEEAAKNYYRGVLFRLKQILKEAGIPDLLETQYGKCRVDKSKYSSDYFRYINGETNLFFGEYMSEYSWAETTVACLLGSVI